MERTSVIIPTFNRENFLVEALDSVLNQSFPPAEVIVIDDGSTDNTAARMQAYGDKIHYIKKENTGKADSLNKALEITQHPLIWIMDDDDLAMPDALKTMTSLLDGKPETGIAYGKYKRFTDNSQTGEREMQDGGFWFDGNSENLLVPLMRDFWIHHPGMIVRKSAYDAAGPFSRKYPRLEDYEMALRLAAVTKAAQTDETVFWQRQHDGERADGTAAEKRTQRWISEEKDCFTEVYNNTPLQVFIDVPDETSLTPSQKRHALIERAVIMGRKKLWDFALSDLANASQLENAGEAPLSEQETLALRQIMFSKYGCPEFLENPKIVQSIRHLSALSETGRAISKVLARNQLWFIRTNATELKLKPAFKHMNVMISLMLGR